MSNLEIWYRRKNEKKYHKIKDFILRNNNEPIISWDNQISNKLQEFKLKLYNPIDEDNIPFIPRFGDHFAITDWQNNILNNKFFGVNMEADWIPHGIKEYEENPNYEYNLTIKAKNFSRKEITLDYSRSVYINDILQVIFNNTPSLGGILSNGYLIKKHNYGGENYLLPPIKFVGDQFDALTKVLDLIGWTFSYYYYSEIDSINGLHIITQINMFPKNALISPPNDWIQGFNTQIFINGDLDNIDSYLDDNEKILAEKSFSINENGYYTKNSIKLKMYIKDLSKPEGERKTLIADKSKDTYNIGGVFDVNSVAIETKIPISSVTSSTIFITDSITSDSLDFYQQRLIDNGKGTKLRCRIISGGTEHFSDFTIVKSTNTITLETAVTSLSTSDKADLSGCYDIFRANLNQYPDEKNGFIIKTLDPENSTIKFTEYDRPENGQIIVYYCYPIKSTYKTKKDADDIDLTGFRGLTETIKDPVTVDQADLIFQEYLKIMKPAFTLKLQVSHRKNILELNTLISILLDTINQNYIVTASKGQILSEEGFYKNRPLITQDLEISNYKFNIEDILSTISNQAQALENMNLINQIQEVTNNVMRFKERGIDSPDILLTPSIIEAINIESNKFTLRFYSSTTSTYLIDLDQNSSFTENIKRNETIYIVSAPNNPVSYDFFNPDGYSYPVYSRIRALKGTELSKYSNILAINNNIGDFVINSNTLYYYKYQNNTNDEKGNLNASLNGSATFTDGIITNDNYCLYYSSPSWLTTANDNSNYDNFTIRRAIYFETGNKASKSAHIFTSKYNTHDFGSINGVPWYLDFITSTNEIRFFIAQNDGKYRLAKCTYNLLENTIYVIQAAFKKVDPSNSNLNTFEICVNGIKQSITFDQDTSNISNVLMTNMPIYTNAEIGNTGNVIVGKYKDLRQSVDLEFRTETEALTDYNNITRV